MRIVVPTRSESNFIQEAIYTRNYYHKKAIKDNDAESMNNYRIYCNHVTFLIRKYKSDYYNTSISTNSYKPKKMWKTLKELLPSKSGYNNCTAFSPDEFNDYFSTIGNT